MRKEIIFIEKKKYISVDEIMHDRVITRACVRTFLHYISLYLTQLSFCCKKNFKDHKFELSYLSTFIMINDWSNMLEFNDIMTL